MKIEFYKYQGTGNDFIMVDNREGTVSKNNVSGIKNLCDRRFGIGADGLILLENHHVVDFSMVYFNADGNQSTMCGNGGRCIMAFANFLNIVKDTATFEAIDGLHKARIDDNLVELQMQDVQGIKNSEGHYFLNTGSPHVVIENADTENINVFETGQTVRNSPAYISEGTNVNFYNQLNDETFLVRTYERGVEDETLSCGTGVTAVALVVYETGKSTSTKIKLNTLGGELSVSFKTNGSSYSDIWLIGPAEQVFKGEIHL